MRDGFMDYPFNPTSRQEWSRHPGIRNAFRMMVPLAANSPWSPALGPAHLPWLFQKQAPEKWPRPTRSRRCGSTTGRTRRSPRSTPARWRSGSRSSRSSSRSPTRWTRRTGWPTTCFPDATDLESLQLMRIGSTKFIEQFWNRQGWAVRQPVVDPVVDARDITDIATELARRTGLLEGYNQAINRGAAGMRLASGRVRLLPRRREGPLPEAIWDAVAHAASHDLTGGEQVVGIDWFREHGFLLRPYSEMEWFLYPTLKERGAALRAPLPGAHQAPRRGARPPPPRDGDRVVGPPAPGVRAAAHVRAVPGHLVGLRARGGARPRRVPVLGPHRPQHAVLVGRERRDSPHQRGRGQRGRPPRGADEPRCRARARDRGRRSGDHRVGGGRDAGQGGAPRGGPAGHGGHDRAVRPLGDAVREGPRAREPQLGDAARALPHRLDGERGGPDAGAGAPGRRRGPAAAHAPPRRPSNPGRTRGGGRQVAP